MIGSSKICPVAGRMFIVVVLYKLNAKDSLALQSIQRAINKSGTSAGDFGLLLFDNSSADFVAEVPSQYVDVYLRAKRNEGVAGAYNCALRLAVAEGFEWLLTLDQDTTVPEGFLEDMLAVTRRFSNDNSVAAVVPRLLDRGRPLSPSRMRLWGNEMLPADFTGFAKGEIQALNSASIFRVSFLKELGGFSKDFWLDFLDVWIFGQIFRAGKRVFVAGHVSVEHELSLLDFENRVSNERFTNILRAESAYMDLYASGAARILYDGRLMARLCLAYKRKRSRAMIDAIEHTLKSRLFQTRKQRINTWLDLCRERSLDAGA